MREGNMGALEEWLSTAPPDGEFRGLFVIVIITSLVSAMCE